MAIDKKTIINSWEEKRSGKMLRNITYSRTHRTLFHDRYNEQQMEDGPIAGRTRSQTKTTKPKPKPNPEGDPRNDEPLFYTNIRGTPPQPALRHVQSGAIVKRRSSKLALQRSDRKLRNTRENIRRHLTNDDKFRDNSGRLRDKYYERIYMLGTLTSDGSLGRVDGPLRAKWTSDEDMKLKRDEKKVGKSKNWEMNKYWTAEELEEEFGIVPGDGHLRDEELDREDYLDMQAYKKRRERFINFIERGHPTEGVWEKVLKLNERELAMLGRWVVREVMSLRKDDMAVMDDKAVAIVRAVWEMVGGIE